MKIYVLIFSLAFLITACSSQNEYELEDKVMKCFYEQLEDNGKEYKKNLDNLEKLFIENGLLQTADGEGYITFYEKVIEHGDLGFAKTNDDFLEIFESKVFNVGFACNDGNLMQDTAKIFSSRMYGIVQVYEDVEKLGRIDFVEISKSILGKFGSKDFEHDLYKSYFFVILGSFIIPIGIEAKLPPWSEENYNSVDSNNILSIYVNPENEIIINDFEKVNAKEIKQIAKDFLLDTIHHTAVVLPGFGEQYSSSKKIISLINDRGTNYKIYLEVYNGVKGAYDEIWNEKSLELFDKEFKDLEHEEKKVIQTIYPLVISEAEPTDVR